MIYTVVGYKKKPRGGMHPELDFPQAFAFDSYLDADNFLSNWKKTIKLRELTPEADGRRRLGPQLPGSMHYDRWFIPDSFMIVDTEYHKGDQLRELVENRRRINQTAAMKSVLPIELPGHSYVSSFFGGRRSKKRSRRSIF